MNTKANGHFPQAAAQASPTSKASLTLEERLQRIEAIAQKINGYIQFMCQVATLNGTSAEAKEKAVTVFYERMVIVESQLSRIHEDFRLE